MGKYDHGVPYSLRKNGQVYYYRLEGSRVYKSTGKRNLVDARAFAKDAWEKSQNPKFALEDVTLAKALEPYYTDSCPHTLRVRAEGKTVGAYHMAQGRASLNKYVVTEPLGKMKLGEIRRSTIIDWRDSLVKKYGLRSAVKYAVTYLKTAVKEMYFREEIDRDPTAGIGMLKVPTKPRDRFHDEELAKLFEGRPGNFASSLAWDLFRFAVLTGMRRGEILALAWAQVNFSRSFISVERAFTTYGQEISTPKWGKVRIAPMLPEAREILLRQPQEGEFVFHYPGGAHLGGTWWEKNFKAAMKTAGITRPGLTAHSLRHTLNSIWRAAGVPDYIIRASLGWTRESTQDIYSHITPENLRGLPGID